MLKKYLTDNAVVIALCFIMLFQQFPLRSTEIFNTSGFACTREKKYRMLTWENDRFRVIRKGQLWMGMITGSVSDLGFALERDSDNTFLFRGNWDHYHEPSGINDQVVDMDFSPDYIFLAPGDSLSLYYHCQDVGDTNGEGNIIVNIWSFP